MDHHAGPARGPKPRAVSATQTAPERQEPKPSANRRNGEVRLLALLQARHSMVRGKAGGAR